MTRFQDLILHDKEFSAALLKVAAEFFGLDSKLKPKYCRDLGCENCNFNHDFCKSCAEDMYKYLSHKMVKHGELIRYKNNPGIFIDYMEDNPGFARIKIEDGGKIRLLTVLISQIERFKYGERG